LVIYTNFAESLSQAMHWISSSYVRYYNKRYNLSGHLWQGRYKSFIVQEDTYLLVLLKYVEANPLRAKIVNDSIEYTYSSAYKRVNKLEDKLVDDSPIDLPSNWHEFINEIENKTDIDSIRNSITRQSPLGDENWRYMIAKTHGLESTLNPRGRPWKKENE